MSLSLKNESLIVMPCTLCFVKSMWTIFLSRCNAQALLLVITYLVEYVVRCKQHITGQGIRKC